MSEWKSDMEPAFDLMAAAETALEKAYAPYSKFRVGAAILTEAGNVYSACNVENVSYGLTVCAERNAIGRAIAEEGPALRITALAIANRDATGVSIPCSPCGACRQVIAEFADPKSTVLYQGEDGIIETTAGELLPDGFRF